LEVAAAGFKQGVDTCDAEARILGHHFVYHVRRIGERVVVPRLHDVAATVDHYQRPVRARYIVVLVQEVSVVDREEQEVLVSYYVSLLTEDYGAFCPFGDA
jgi:hypothetical protein